MLMLYIIYLHMLIPDEGLTIYIHINQIWSPLREIMGMKTFIQKRYGAFNYVLSFVLRATKMSQVSPHLNKLLYSVFRTFCLVSIKCLFPSNKRNIVPFCL